MGPLRGWLARATRIDALDRRLVLIFLLALASLAAAGAVGVRSTRRLVVASDSTARTFERIAQLSSVLDALQDQETGARGYVISGNEEFLEPYHRANAVVGSELEHLTAMYHDDSLRSRRLEALRALIVERRLYIDSSITLRREVGFAAAQALIVGGQGKSLMDQIRGEMGSLFEHERELLNANRASEAAATVSATRTAILAGLFAVILVATAVVILRRENAKRRATSVELRRLNLALERRIEDVRSELAGSEARLRDALDHLIEGCVIVSPDMRFEFVNRAAAVQGRLSPEEMVGQRLADVYPGFETTELYAAVRACVTDNVSRQFDTEFHFADRSSIWIRVSVEPITLGAFVLSVDITEHVEAERALRQSEARHRALLEGLPDTVYLLDADGIIVDYHAPDPTLLLLSVDELIGRPFAATVPPAAAVVIATAINEAREKRRPQTVQYDVTLSQGTRRFEANIVVGEFGRVTIVAHDITVRQSLEEQLRQSQKMEAVGQLTGGIAHDFNNVLTVISSNAELLASEVMPGAPIRDELQDILTASRRGADMIAQLLRFSRRGMVVKRPVDPAPVITAFLAMLRRLVPSSVQLRVGTLATGSTILLDTGSLEQVLANLCTNARDAMPNGGEIRLSCESTFLDSGYHATHPWVEPGPYVCLSVEDTGIGMDEATRARVFEPFFTTKPEGIGTGLGMAMVYGIMKEHRGMVHLYSEPGRGTTVKLYFPVVKAEADTSAATPHRDAGTVGGGAEQLLLVEDDLAIQKASRRALESKGYRVLVASDGEQALELMRQHGPEISLIISDLVMPNLGGRQMAEILRADGVTTPIIFTSGYSANTVYQSGEFPERTSFLHKPWTLTDLFTQVRRVLDASA